MSNLRRTLAATGAILAVGAVALVDASPANTASECTHVTGYLNSTGGSTSKVC